MRAPGNKQNEKLQMPLKALSSSEQRVRAIIDSALDAIIVFDYENKILEWNKQAENTFGWSKSEVLGRDIAEVAIAPRYREVHYKGMAKFLGTGESKILNKRVRTEGIHKDGSIFPVESTATAHEIDGKHYFTAFVRDISETIQDERNRELLATIVESSDDAIISKTLEGIITSWNSGAERIFGFTADEALGRNISIIIPPDRIDEEARIIDQLKKGNRFEHFETVRITKDGKLREVSETISPLKDAKGNIFGISKVVRDITSQKVTLSQLQGYSEKLKLSNEALDDFVYIISHDLKEPLRGMYNYAQFIEEDYKDKLDEEARSKLGTFRNLAQRMETIIDRLLEYSRLGRMELAFRQTDLNEVLDETISLLDPILKTEDISINVQENLPVIVCDHARVSEIFRNLIVNAIKYNESPRKTIEIGCTVTTHPKRLNCYTFFVKDNGIGIPEKQRKNIFKMFNRLHGHDAYGGGTGSGLAIVEKIVSRHNGKIWIEENVNQGSVFYFTLETEGPGDLCS